MAYAFLLASSRSLSTSSAPVSNAPMTIACWCRPTANGSMALVAVGVSSGSHRNQIQISNGPILQIASQGSLGAQVHSGGSVTLNSWNHAAGVFDSTASRTAYTNGTASLVQSLDCGSQNAANSVVCGARWNSTLGLYYSGDIAEVGVWNVALSAAEIASLAKGVTCDLIRPQSLVFYAPLIRDLVDVRGGLAITNNNGATVANHPRAYA